MTKTRNHRSPEEKAALLRRHHIDKVPVTTICEEAGLQASVFYHWQRELFEQSPHAEAAKAGAFSECVSCHGNHAIQKATVELFESACAPCHANDARPQSVRDSVSDLIRGSKSLYGEAEWEVRQATVRGLSTEDEQLLLQEAQTQVTQLEGCNKELR